MEDMQVQDLSTAARAVGRGPSIRGVYASQALQSLPALAHGYKYSQQYEF